MNCSGCGTPCKELGELGMVRFRNCEHFACRSCLAGAVVKWKSDDEKEGLRCLINKMESDAALELKVSPKVHGPYCKGLLTKEDIEKGVHLRNKTSTTDEGDVKKSQGMEDQAASLRNRLETEERDARNREFQLNEEFVRRNIRMGAFRPCPHCSIIWEKDGGCDHMVCGSCECSFSWSDAKSSTNV